MLTCRKHIGIWLTAYLRFVAFLSFKFRIERDMGHSCPNKQFRVIQTQKHEILTVKSEVTAMGGKLKTLAAQATDKIRRFLANLSSFLSRI